MRSRAGLPALDPLDDDSDTDGDGFNNGVETATGSDPLDSESIPPGGIFADGFEFGDTSRWD